MNIKLSHIALIGIFAIAIMGFSRVYALTGPQSNAPTQPEISVPVNHSEEMQTKKGGISTQIEGISAGIFFLTTLPGSTETFARGQTVQSSNKIISPWAFFTKFHVGKGKLEIGRNADDSSLLPPIKDVNTTGSSVIIDLQGRGTANNSDSGTKAMSIYTGDSGNSCSTYTTIRTNTPGVEFKTTMSDRADIIAQQVQLKGGNPTRNSVLVSVDENGRATWATATVVGGQIQLVPNTTSPVKLGSNMCI